MGIIGKGGVVFQSTHPLRGATDGVAVLPDVAAISIHAPLAGCDVLRNVLCNAADDISIHAPLAGCDNTSLQGSQSEGISIHAPLAGCD